MIEIEAKAREQVANYFLTMGVRYFLEIKSEPSVFIQDLSRRVQPEVAKLGYEKLFKYMGRLLYSSVFRRIVDKEYGADQDLHFEHKLEDITRLLERRIIRSQRMVDSFDYNSVIDSIRSIFDKNNFKKQAYDFLNGSRQNQSARSHRVVEFREARKLFIENLIDRISEEIWTDEECSYRR